jgi:hypothetical protein
MRLQSERFMKRDICLNIVLNEPAADSIRPTRACIRRQLRMDGLL